MHLHLQATWRSQGQCLNPFRSDSNASQNGRSANPVRVDDASNLCLRVKGASTQRDGGRSLRGQIPDGRFRALGRVLFLGNAA